MYEAIQKQGANARAIGASQFDNPYMKADRMPVSAGEPLLTWQDKLDAWDTGRQMENAMRSGQEEMAALARLLAPSAATRHSWELQ